MQRTIYVVDDEADIRKIIRSYLEKAGYTVCEFENGEDTLRAFASVLPDMLIIDIMMPGMSGFELCNEIRKRPIRRLLLFLPVTRNWIAFWALRWARTII